MSEFDFEQAACAEISFEQAQSLQFRRINHRCELQTRFCYIHCIYR